MLVSLARRFLALLHGLGPRTHLCHVAHVAAVAVVSIIQGGHGQGGSVAGAGAHLERVVVVHLFLWRHAVALHLAVVVATNHGTGAALACKSASLGGGG